MKLLYYPTLAQVEQNVLDGAAVAVIDVLRSSSTIVAALESGAERIIPVEDIETASRLVSRSDRGARLLAGECRGRPIDGFDLFNSPLECTPGVVAGKTIVLTTSNGTRAILSVARAKRIVVCAINNVSAVAEVLKREAKVAIVCCGNEGRLAAEDLLCGGVLLTLLGEGVPRESFSDAARISLLLAERFGLDIEGYLRTCDRGRELVASGYGSDVAYCSMQDNCSRVPELRQNAIT